MKTTIYTLLILMFAQVSVAQQVYCDFDGVKVVTFGAPTGILDSLFLNPSPIGINTSAHCAKYIRDTAQYDNIRVYPDTTLQNVAAYADASASAPKMTMKLYSSAPVGTVVLMQLGKRSDDFYPTGVHSEYIATTTSKNAWQDITFQYLQSPPGSLTSPTQIDKIVILFHPNSNARDTMYFDSLRGPELNTATTGIAEVTEQASLKLYQNSPNPAKENTRINFQLGSSGLVSLKLYDMLGNSISSVLNQNMKSGIYSIPVDTENIPNGIYFYVLKTGKDSRSMKMIVSK